MFYQIPEGNRMAMGTRQQRERQQGLWFRAVDIRRGGGQVVVNLVARHTGCSGFRLPAKIQEYRISVLTWLDWPHVPGSASLSLVCFCHPSIFFRSFACTAAYSGFP